MKILVETEEYTLLAIDKLFSHIILYIQMDLSFVENKNRLSRLELENKIVQYVMTRIQTLPDQQALKNDPELVLLVCNLIENSISKEDKINKKEVVLNIMTRLFTLSPQEKSQASNIIEFLWENKQIVKISFFKKIFKLFVNYLKKKL